LVNQMLEQICTDELAHRMHYLTHCCVHEEMDVMIAFLNILRCSAVSQEKCRCTCMNLLIVLRVQ